ncbi:MAG: glucose-6-phosphate dehydrogenase assembly protein OpcA [Actinomycetota bacterium]|nr:glucose-6-phosphate dehydrogenase assembly protein OpcA [Actinomycetota bacterium]
MNATFAASARMATIGSWEAEDVTVGQVEAALSDLRRHERRAAVRASVVTLVAVVADDSAADAALEIVYDLGSRHPSRTIVLVLEEEEDPEKGTRLDATASVNAVDRSGRTVCFEDVVLRVRGRARHHLDSVVEPFTLPDLPVVVWLPAQLPAPGDPLLSVADRIVVDSRAVAGAGTAPGGETHAVLPSIAALARRLPVADLSWTRLAPWRSLLAGLFEGAEFRPFLREIERVEVAGNYGPRHLLGGWLLRRLGVPDTRVILSPADHVSIRITAAHRDRTGVFAVERPGNARVIHSSVHIDRGPSLSQTVRMRQQWPALALAGALTRMGRDDLYCQAIEGALELRKAGTATP